MKRWIALAASLSAVIALLAAWVMPLPFSSDQLRRHIVDELSARLESRVELGPIRFRAFPRLAISGERLVIRHKRHVEVPLISVQSFEVSSSLRRLWRWRVEEVVLRGLEIRIPPSDKDEDDVRQTDSESKAMDRLEREVIIEQLVADDSTLTILRRDPEKPPRVWRMHRLRLQSVGIDQSMPFQSTLTNAVPPGEIETNGRFGPWNADDPGRTPLGGAFVFEQANLGVFKGIAGTLASHGDYRGSLERLEVDGQTSTPDFMLTLSSRPVSLNTTYRAVVDATNGNTTLDRVDASFGKTALTASGGVYEVPGVKGRRVSLTVTMKAGRLEDILTLAVDTPKPTMTGGLALTTALELPPGDRDVVDKLELKGDFDIDAGRFTNQDVQAKINALSGRARGRGAENPARVSSNFRGRFALKEGRLQLAPVRFDIPGALVEVTGRYELRPGSLAFAGQVMMDAAVSQAVGGWKSFLLKPIDPLFRRDGRTFVPITISGSRADPQFGIDRRRIFNKDAPPVVPQPTAAKPAPRPR